MTNRLFQSLIGKLTTSPNFRRNPLGKKFQSLIGKLTTLIPNFTCMVGPPCFNPS